MSPPKTPRRYSTVYQIFVDRFEPGGPVPPQPERAAEEGTVRRPFGADPDMPPTGKDLQGGTLAGIAQRLPHVCALADALYLTPVCRAPSNHKYDAADFDAVDEHFGGEPALTSLLAATRTEGLDVFLDAVLNHVGERHPWARDPAYVRYLRGHGWRGHGSLPEVDFAHPPARAELLTLVGRMIARGAAGLRLDCANDLGTVFCGEIAAAIAQAGGRGGAIGELMAWPAPFLQGGALDGVMNYWLRNALETCGVNEAQIPVAQRSLDRLAAAVPLERLLRSWTILSSHDTRRLSDQVGFDEARARLWLAVQFAYPGTPMIYYGEEVGMRGGDDPGCRGAMIWDEARWDLARLAHVQRLVELRRSLPALIEGDYVPLDVPRGILGFARTTGHVSDTIICVANPTGREVKVELPLPIPGFYGALPVVDLLGGPTLESASSWVRVSLPPQGVCWLSPRDEHGSAYRFWKSHPL